MIEKSLQICLLIGLNQAEMAFRQVESLLTGHAAEDRDLRHMRGGGRPHDFLVAIAAGTVEHDACDFDIGSVAGKPGEDRRRGIGLCAYIDDQNYRPAHSSREVRSRAVALTW